MVRGLGMVEWVGGFRGSDSRGAFAWDLVYGADRRCLNVVRWLGSDESWRCLLMGLGGSRFGSRDVVGISALFLQGVYCVESGQGT